MSPTVGDILPDGENGKQPANPEVRLEFNPDYDLQQQHVLEVMLEQDRPYFTKRQIRSKLKSDPSEQTIARRLNELAELDLVETDEYSNLTLYYLDDSRSVWPVPGDLGDIQAPDEVTLWDLLTFQSPQVILLAGQYGIYLSMYLLLVGAILSTVGVSELFTVRAPNQFIEAGLVLLFALLPLPLVQGVVTKSRELLRS